jgi:hypothetical protein
VDTVRILSFPVDDFSGHLGCEVIHASEPPGWPLRSDVWFADVASERPRELASANVQDSKPQTRLVAGGARALRAYFSDNRTGSGSSTGL